MKTPTLVVCVRVFFLFTTKNKTRRETSTRRSDHDFTCVGGGGEACGGRCVRMRTA